MRERSLAGHRVLRLLARGERSLVWLAKGDLVLKQLTVPVAASQPGREAEALHRARGEHVVELHDVSLGAEGAVLVFPRLPLGSLADLLRRRQNLDAGEAVTVLAPIASCVARMHAAGVAMGSLSPASVLFRRDGAPMLTGFGAAELFPPALPEVDLERIAGVVADRRALLGLADAVLVRTTGARGKVAGRLRDELLSTAPEKLSGRMTQQLFELAASRPVRFEADEQPSPPESRRVVPVGKPVGEPDGARERASVLNDAEVASDSAAAWRGLFAGVRHAIDVGPRKVVVDLLAKRWGSWSPSRRRALVAAGAAALALVIAMSVVPGSDVPAGTAAEPHPAVPAESAAPFDANQNPGSSGAGDLLGDDPVIALRELVERRERCFRELSVLCLDGVDEQGSAALEFDRAALRAVLDGGIAPQRLAVSAAVLVERLGDSALVELGATTGNPTSILLLKSANGWRIRDYLTAVASDAE